MTNPSARYERQALRRAVRLECQAVREADFRLLGTRAVDLSPFGMRILSDADVGDLSLGDEVLVTFRAPASHHWIDVVATVIARFDGSIGLHFEEMDEASRSLLARTLRGLPPPLPRVRGSLVDGALGRAQGAA